MILVFKLIFYAESRLLYWFVHPLIHSSTFYFFISVFLSFIYSLVHEFHASVHASWISFFYSYFFTMKHDYSISLHLSIYQLSLHFNIPFIYSLAHEFKTNMLRGFLYFIFFSSVLFLPRPDESPNLHHLPGAKLWRVGASFITPFT